MAEIKNHKYTELRGLTRFLLLLVGLVLFAFWYALKHGQQHHKNPLFVSLQSLEVGDLAKITEFDKNRKSIGSFTLSEELLKCFREAKHVFDIMGHRDAFIFHFPKNDVYVEVLTRSDGSVKYIAGLSFNPERDIYRNTTKLFEAKCHFPTTR